MTERFLPDKKASKKQIKALRTHVREAGARLAVAPGAGSRGGCCGIGGTVRNLAAASELAEELPSYGVQGFAIRREVLDDLVDRFASSTATERRRIPGIKPERADLILAGSLVIQSIMELGEFAALEATEAGLREGVFFATLLAGTDPPLFADVRHKAVRNLARSYEADLVHADHVAALSLQMFDELAAARRARGQLRRARAAVGGRDPPRHRHGGRLRRPPQALALPDPQRRAPRLLHARAGAHRPDGPLSPQGLAEPRDVRPIARTGDDAHARSLLGRPAHRRAARALARPERARRHLESMDGTVAAAPGLGRVDVPLARWAAEREADLFERAFGKALPVGR